LQEELQNHETDDGFTSIRFRVAPKRLHQNEIGVPEEFLDTEANKKQRTLSSQEDQISSNKERNEGDGRLLGNNNMKSEEDDLLGDNPYRNYSREKLVEIIKWLKNELEVIKKNPSNYGPEVRENYERDLKKAEDLIARKESDIQQNSSSPTSPESNNAFLPAVLLAVGASLIGGLVF
jgi:hypothetical protein